MHAQSDAMITDPWAYWLANRIPSRQACASASTASWHLNKTRQAVNTTCFSQSRATTPMPASPVCGTKEPSTLTLIHPAGDGFHAVFPRSFEPALLCLLLSDSEQVRFPLSFTVLSVIPDGLDGVVWWLFMLKNTNEMWQSKHTRNIYLTNHFEGIYTF